MNTDRPQPVGASWIARRGGDTPLESSFVFPFGEYALCFPRLKLTQALSQAALALLPSPCCTSEYLPDKIAHTGQRIPTINLVVRSWGSIAERDVRLGISNSRGVLAPCARPKIGSG